MTDKRKWKPHGGGKGPAAAERMAYLRFRNGKESPAPRLIKQYRWDWFAGHRKGDDPWDIVAFSFADEGAD